MINTVIFDLDGVLVSTDELHYLAWKRLAEELNITGFTKADNERQRGVSRMESLEVVLEKSDKSYTDDEKMVLAEKKNDYYKESLRDVDGSIILPGAVETLKLLHERGVKVGVGSASKNTPAILDKTGLAGLIDKVSCGLDTDKSKPEPDVFLIAAEKLGSDPSMCLVVEDSAAGIEAAKRAGMKSLGVGPFNKTLGASICADNLADNLNWDRILN